MLSTHGHGGAHTALTRQCVGKCFVAARNHIASRGGALVDEHGFDRLAAAHGQAFVDNGFERQLLTTAHLVVCGDDGDSARVDDAFLQGFGGKTAKDDTVGSADARTGLHSNHAFERHGHIDQYAVAFLDTRGPKRVGKLADPRQ